MSKEIGESSGWYMPFTLGHEIGGYIEKIGDDVRGFVNEETYAVIILI